MKKKPLTPRQIKALQTKQKILETALHLFSKKSFDQVTVDEIVSECNVSKGAFYVHFKSKYEIFHEKFKEIDDFYSQFIESLPEDISYSEKIIRLTKVQMEYFRDVLGFDVMRTFYMSALMPDQGNDYLSDWNRTLYKIIHSFVLKGQESGEFQKEISAYEITMFITRSMRGSLYDWFLFKDEYNLVTEAVKYIEIFLQGIRK
jgi:AcrR family transcriptional regulator